MKAIELRPARWADQGAVAALASKIWNGQDYLADCFDDWVKDNEGQFILALSENSLAACNKLTRLGPQEWWLEGLRVDPQFRGMGLARLLHDYALELIRKKGGGRVRLATVCDNPAVPKIALKTGFTQQDSYLIGRLAGSPVQQTAAARFAPVTAAELNLFQKRLTISDAFAAQGGLMEDGWVWYEILPRLPELHEDGRLFWHADSGGLLIANGRAGEPLAINFMAVEEDAAAVIVGDLPHLGVQLGQTEMRYKPRDTAVNRSVLQQNGWDIDEEILCLFEHSL